MVSFQRFYLGEKVDDLNVTYLGEGMWFDLRELVINIARVHFGDLLPGRRSKDLDDFH